LRLVCLSRAFAVCAPVAAKICAECKQPISAGTSYLEALGTIFHPDCFICNFCQTKLDGPFQMEDNKRKCGKCAVDTADKCARCGKSVMSEDAAERLRVLYIGDSAYHPGCFTCGSCGTALSGSDGEARCYNVEGEIYCHPCAKDARTKPAANPALSEPAQSKQDLNPAPRVGGGGGGTSMERLAASVGTDYNKGEKKW